MRWSPQELARDAGGKLLRAGTRPVEGAFIDSRAPQPGALFVPIVAARDGHAFIDSALAGGAAATLVAAGRPLPAGDASVIEVRDTLEALTALARAARAGRKASGVPAVAITGSNGKTTTRAMVQAVLESAYSSVLSTQGNFNNHLGVPLSLLGAPHQPSAEVLELGMSAPGENDHLAGIVAPQIGIVTSIALEHLEFMGSLEAIAKAEAELMPHVSSDGALVLPYGVELLEAQIPADYQARIYRVGPETQADIRIESVEVGTRTRCRFVLPGGERVEVALATFGAHNARNAGAALAVGLQLALPIAPMLEALETVRPVGDRGRVREYGEHMMICDCYNANPGSMQVALESLAATRATRRGPLVAVLGDMLELGPRSMQLHHEVGAQAAALGIDAVLAFGPLSEAIARGASEGGVEQVEAITSLDHASGVGYQDAVQWLKRLLKGEAPGAILFKASRGIKLERVIEGLRSASPSSD